MVKIEIERAEVFVMWSWAETSDEARRGHAYLFADATRARWLSFEHGRERTPQMLALLERWRAAHASAPVCDPTRARAWWKQPDGRWGFTGDLGRVLAVLDGRALVVEHGDDADPLPALPEAFLRRPIAELVRARLGASGSAPAFAWPREFDAEQVRVGPGGPAVTREDARMVVCAARYGSRFASAGQDRTAAVFCSDDAGASWRELPWTRDPAQRGVAEYSWPPEQIRRVELADHAPVIHWEDPWIDWEPGDEWQATWRPDTGDWWIEIR